MIYLFIAWILAIFVLRWHIGRHKYASSGVVMAYVVDFSLIHLPGGMIYLFPWYDPSVSAYLVEQGNNLTIVRTGFGESVMGLWAFIAGFIFLTPAAAHFFRGQSNLRSFSIHPKLPINYLRISLFIYFIIFPIVRNMPSLNAFFNMSWYLIIVSISLLVWQSYLRGRKDLVIRWVQVSAVSLPMLTTISQGFLGYGVRAFLSIFMFYLTVFKIRKSTYFKLFLIAYLGLSLFVSYMQQREMIRSVAWDESKSIINTIEASSKIFTEFSFFNPMRSDHLVILDGRLNQNVLVGQVISHMKGKNQPFANGETMGDAFLSMIPRALWPSKPMKAGSGDLVSTYTGQKFDENTSVGVGQVIEFYINFGDWGVIIGFLCLGALIGLIDKMATINLKQGDWQGFAFWFLPGMAMIQSGGALAEIAMSSVAGVAFIFTLNKTIFSKYAPKLKARAKNEFQP